MTWRILSFSVLLVLLAVVHVHAGTNFYKVLGVEKSASATQIKRQYRKLSLQYHPDKNKGEGEEEAKKKFVEVANAYEALSDPKKRRIYDRHGEEGLKKQQQGGGRNPFDLFSQFGFGRRHGGDNEEERGPDVTLDLHVSLADLYTGRSFEAAVQHQQLCPRCRGSGARDDDDIETCKVCKGKGHTVRMHQLGPGFVQQVQVPCNACKGKGRIVKHQCPFCSGKKIVKGETVLDVPVEQGMPDGHTIEFENAADEHPDHNAGHLLFKIRTRKDPVFHREGNDLHHDRNITLAEALLGFEHTLTHLDGHDVTISRKGMITPHGRTIRIDGEGMPVYEVPSEKGQLHVRFFVQFPTHLTEEQRNSFAKIF